MNYTENEWPFVSVCACPCFALGACRIDLTIGSIFHMSVALVSHTQMSCVTLLFLSNSLGQTQSGACLIE